MNGSDTVRMDLGDRAYDIIVGAGQIARLGEAVRDRFGQRRAFIVTDDEVAHHWLEPARRGLEASGIATSQFILPKGESTKSFAQLERLLDWLLGQHVGRDGLVIALGGGVVGDLASFAAAITLRGLDFVQVPTTLLSQVDSSVGGKTGLNHEGSKNLIGTFHQPSLVFCALGALKTLDKRELRSGLAEMLKAGIIRDATLIQELLTHGRTLEDANPEVLLPLVTRSVAIKARIVEEDEREGGIRALLNFGHTFGHALEAADGLGKWAHGEAVAIGMVAAAHVSCGLGLAEAELPQQITHLLEKMGLPVSCENTPGWKEALLKDKKARGKDVLFVALHSLEKPKIIQISLKQAIFWIEMGLFGYSTEPEGVHHDES